MAKSNYDILVDNIHTFVRKYYQNQLVKGILLFVAISLLFYLLLIGLEYFLWLKATIKIALISVYTLIIASGLVKYIAIPTLRLLGILPQLSHEKSAEIISKNLKGVDDKLLNTIQLYQMSQTIDSAQMELLSASIEQKSLELRPFKFSFAVDFKTNKKYVKYALFPIALFAILLLSSPKTLLQPSLRLMDLDSNYINLPFRFQWVNTSSEAIEGEDFKVAVKLEGEQIPEDLLIELNGFNYLMQKEQKQLFSYVIRNLKGQQNFRFKSGNIYSNSYKITPLKRPYFRDFTIHVKYPKYLMMKAESFSNISELLLPEGSTLQLNVSTRQADRVEATKDSSLLLGKFTVSDQSYVLEPFKLMNPFDLELKCSNSSTLLTDSFSLRLLTIVDEYPRINVKEFKDSIEDLKRYFQLDLEDDHGFKNLRLHVKYKNSDKIDTSFFTEIPLDKSLNPMQLQFFYDFHNLNIAPGSILEYYFVLRDNDAVHGYKATKTNNHLLHIKSLEERKKDINQRQEAFSSDVFDQMQQSKKVSKKMEELIQKLKSEKKLSWETKQQAKDMLHEYEELQKQLKKAKEKLAQNIEKDKKLSPEDEAFLKKQEALKKLLEEVLTPEMKELMEEMQKLLEKNAPQEKLLEQMEKLKMDADYLQDQMDRDMELLKQMKFDKMLDDAIQKLDELAQKQDELRKQNDTKELSDDQLSEKQDSLNKAFDDFKKELREARQLNDSLEESNKMESTEQEEKSTEEALKEALDKLKKSSNKGASKSQQKASKSMKQLQQKLEQMQANMESQANAEDMDNLANIMNNLVEISFNQESLMKKISRTSNRDPKFPKFLEDQKKITQDLQMVEDSLQKLAKRNPSVAPFINKEMAKINNYSTQVFQKLRDMNTIAPSAMNQAQNAEKQQQYIMTSVNNLALMLQETLDRMKQQQMQKSGKGNCKKPKPGMGKGMKSMKQMQQQLKKQMEKMLQQMKQGQQKGQQKGPGKSKGSGEEKMSEEMARMAAQQEAIRKQLQKYKEKLSKEGNLKQAGELGKIADEMEKSETEMINQMITNESLMRQKEILTRLLESEKAMRERDEKEERESKEGKNVKKSNKNLIIEYKKNNLNAMELYRTIPPNLQPFYKQKVNEYYRK